MPQVTRLGQQAHADAERIVDRAFRKGLLLISSLLAGSALAGLAYGILAAKLPKPLEAKV